MHKKRNSILKTNKTTLKTIINISGYSVRSNIHHTARGINKTNATTENGQYFFTLISLNNNTAAATHTSAVSIINTIYYGIETLSGVSPEHDCQQMGCVGNERFGWWYLLYLW